MPLENCTYTAVGSQDAPRVTKSGGVEPELSWPCYLTVCGTVVAPYTLLLASFRPTVRYAERQVLHVNYNLKMTRVRTACLCLTNSDFLIP